MPRKIIKRGKAKVEFHISAVDIYREFLKAKDVRRKELTQKEFIKILRAGNQLLLEWMIKEKGTLKLPKNTDLRIVKFKRKIEDRKYAWSNIDFGKTLATGETHYNFNDHTDGYEFRLYWHKKKCRWKCHKRYRIAPLRHMRRTMAKYIKEGYDFPIENYSR